MEPVGVDPEFLLQLYDDFFLILGWLLGAAAALIAVVFMLCLWFDCFAPYRSCQSRSSKEGGESRNFGRAARFHWPHFFAHSARSSDRLD